MQSIGSDPVPQRSTLLALVLALNERLETAEQVAEEARRLVNDGHVILTGNFRGQRLL